MLGFHLTRSSNGKTPNMSYNRFWIPEKNLSLENKLVHLII